MSVKCPPSFFTEYWKNGKELEQYQLMCPQKLYNMTFHKKTELKYYFLNQKYDVLKYPLKKC